jgi:hypothetical protein
MTKAKTTKKYCLTETRNSLGLYQIKALRDIPRYNVERGDLGGWIAREDNLSQAGDCWVADNAMVSGNARVFDKARVSGKAWVFDDAWVYGNARVYGDVEVYGNREVSGTSKAPKRKSKPRSDPAPVVSAPVPTLVPVAAKIIGIPRPKSLH